MFKQPAGTKALKKRRDLDFLALLSAVGPLPLTTRIYNAADSEADVYLHVFA